MPAPRKTKSSSFPPHSSSKPAQNPRKTPAKLPQKPPNSPLINNLETTGDHLKIYSLQSLLTNKRSPETRATARLGDVLLPWFEQVVSKPAEKLGPITQLWQALVPPNLQTRSRLLGFSRGTLSVALDSATIRAELDSRLRAGLLRQLQTDSRGTIYRVKTCVQSSPE